MNDIDFLGLEDVLEIHRDQVFLALNGIEITAPEDDFEQLVWQVSTGQADKEVIAAFFREHSLK